MPRATGKEGRTKNKQEREKYAKSRIILGIGDSGKFLLLRKNKDKLDNETNHIIWQIFILEVF